MKSQSTSKKRIGHHLSWWLGVIMVCTSTTGYAASPADDCEITNQLPNLLRPHAPTTSLADGISTIQIGTNQPNGGIRWDIPPSILISICYTQNLPDIDDAICEGPDPFMFPDNTEFYIHYVNSVADTRCTYAVTLNSTNATAIGREVSLGRSTTAVPIFTPLGIIATIGGLLWFGRRRKAKVTTD